MKRSEKWGGSNMLQERIKKNVRAGNKNIITIDIFDTLLLRNDKPELQRFHETAVFQEKVLAEQNLGIDRNDLFFSRLICSHVARHHSVPEVDIRLEKIFYLMCNFLKIEPLEYIPRFIDIELDYEKKNLTPNYKLVNFLQTLRKDLKIYFISDTYFPLSLLTQLMDHFIPNFVYDGIYASCDFSTTKRNGQLYDLFCLNEKLHPSQIIHVGDNYKSDVLNTRYRGITSFFFMESLLSKAKRNIKGKILSLRYFRFLPLLHY